MSEGKHTPGAYRLADILIRDAHFGGLTREALADLIDRETGAADLLAALEPFAAIDTGFAEHRAELVQTCAVLVADVRRARAAIAKAKRVNQ